MVTLLSLEVAVVVEVVHIMSEHPEEMTHKVLFHPHLFQKLLAVVE
jgi:hypothetical protein